MCEFASFFHNPKTGEIKVWDLMSHGNTEEKLKLDLNVWREGHYKPSGEVVCRVTEEDEKKSYTEKYCTEMLKQKLPTFNAFLKYALLRLPKKYEGSLNVRGCDLKGVEIPEKYKSKLSR